MGNFAQPQAGNPLAQILQTLGGFQQLPGIGQQIQQPGSTGAWAQTYAQNRARDLAQGGTSAAGQGPAQAAPAWMQGLPEGLDQTLLGQLGGWMGRGVNGQQMDLSTILGGDVSGFGTQGGQFVGVDPNMMMLLKQLGYAQAGGSGNPWAFQGGKWAGGPAAAMGAGGVGKGPGAGGMIGGTVGQGFPAGAGTGGGGNPINPGSVMAGMPSPEELTAGNPVMTGVPRSSRKRGLFGGRF